MNDPTRHPRSRSTPRPKGSFTSPSPQPIAAAVKKAAIPARMVSEPGRRVLHARAQRPATDDAPTVSMRERQARLKAALTSFGALRP